MLVLFWVGSFHKKTHLTSRQPGSLAKTMWLTTEHEDLTLSFKKLSIEAIIQIHEQHPHRPLYLEFR